DDGREGPVAEEFSRKAVTEFSCLIDAAKNKAVALIEQRTGAVERGEITVLRSQRRLQVGRVVDGVRPGVRAEKFVVISKALAQIGGKSVINRAAVGEIRIHVAEGDAVGEGRGIAIGVETLAGQAALDRLGKGHAGAAATRKQGPGDGRI